jgi:pyruvate dehydrogenase E2 component (dihydrolipoamide acetyltransferase)
MSEFTMPSLGADMESGTVSKWLVHRGDKVHRGDIVAVVETEKSNIEVEIFEDGVIDELFVPEGERVPVGTPLAHVVTAPAPAPVLAPPAPAAPLAAAPAGPAAARGGRAARAKEAAPGPGLPKRLRPVRPPRRPTVRAPAEKPLEHAPAFSPVLRHLADQLRVDLALLHGSGLDGKITREDIERAAQTETTGRRPVRSSPLARRRAAELGVDLAETIGSGPSGAILEHDVLAAASKAPPPTPALAGAPAETPPAGEVGGAEDRQAALRRSIGALMARSKREIPHYYLSTTIAAGAALEWLEETNRQRPVEDRLVLPVLLLKATARAVAAVPEMNGFYVDGAFVRSEAVHVGVAVSLRSGGVIAPAIHDVDRLGLDELMRRLGDLVARARRGTLRASEMSDPTITVTNLGDLGVEAVFGVIYPPQVALVGFGRVTESPYAKDGMLGICPVVTATLSADHRVSDGHRGGRFLAQINRLLQEPDAL